MNRRSYLKSVLILGVAGAASFSIFEWFELKGPIQLSKIMDKRNVLAELVEVIIPATDTPGAKAAMVHDYIINLMISCNTPRMQKTFISGIQDMEDYAVQNYKKDFLKCSSAEKHAIMDHFSKNTGYSNRFLNKVSDKLFGAPFYLRLRSVTVEGYCMSKLGATQGLAYDYIPGTYEACIPIRPNQKSWATK